jgi:hypothetical protein
MFNPKSFRWLACCSLLLFCIHSFQVNAQAPDGINYQAVIRNFSNTLVANSTIAIRIQIKQTSASGTIVFQERHSVTTSAQGVVNLVIGQGTLLGGNFSTINWATGPYFVSLGVSFTNGTNYLDYGSQQLMSVPYALYAKNAGNQLNQWRYGNSIPAAALGAMGDFYLNMTNGNVYYKSNATTWALTGNITGPAGVAGATGPIGLTGPAGANGANGAAGPQGIQGLTGPAGPAGGPAGPVGPAGTNGISAYQSALNNGYVGTEASWLASLTGATGPQGLIGPVGPAGINGTNGNSAYQSALINGYVGTEAAWLASLTGATGPAGATGAAGMPGPQGNQGIQGPAGGGVTVNCGTASNTNYTIRGDGSGIYECTNALVITSTGKVGIGTLSPSSSFDLNIGSGGFLVDGTSSTSNILGRLRIGSSSSSTYDLQVDGHGYFTSGLRIGTTSAPLTGGILANGIIESNTRFKQGSSTSGTGTTMVRTSTGELRPVSSTKFVKDNIRDLIFSKEKVFALRPVIYNLKPALGGEQEIGLIAEEVAEVMPELVILGPERQWVGNTGIPQTDANGVEINDPSKMVPYSVYYDRLPVYLLSIIKEQEERINALEKRLNALEKE